MSSLLTEAITNTLSKLTLVLLISPTLLVKTQVSIQGQPNKVSQCVNDLFTALHELKPFLNSFLFGFKIGVVKTGLLGALRNLGEPAPARFTCTPLKTAISVGPGGSSCSPTGVWLPWSVLPKANPAFRSDLLAGLSSRTP